MNGLSLKLFNEADGGSLAFHFVDLAKSDDQRIETIAGSITAWNDVIFVHAPIKQIERIVAFPCVRAYPTEILSDTTFANEPGTDMNPKTVIIFAQLLSDTFEVRQLLAKQL